MKTFAALTGVGGGRWPALHQVDYPYILIAFPHDRRGVLLDRLDYKPEQPMLDSGAFSALTLGIELNVEEYADWCVSYAQRYPHVRVTNLDVIPGAAETRGSAMSAIPPTKKELKRAIDESAYNANVIREHGLRVIEVHHLLDPIDNLAKIVERRRDGEMIGIGGLAKGAVHGVRVKYGNGVFARLRDLCGWDALPPTHGFGVSDDWAGFRWPLATCDSSTWIAPERFGRVLKGFRTVKLDAQSSHRIRNYTVGQSECVKFLTRWRHRELQIRKHWEDRNVNILEVGDAFYAQDPDPVAA